MEGARRTGDGLEAAGVTLAAAVPDTWIGTLMGEARRSPGIRALDVAREEEAVAAACGAHLAGGRGAALIQNAGQLWINPHYESSGGQALPGVAVDWAGLARASGIRHGWPVGDVEALRAAYAHAAAAALLVVEGAFDPGEPIPPYSERPDEIGVRFASRMAESGP